jgi:hypothetical protein
MLSFRNVPNFARPRKRGPSEYGDFDRLLRKAANPMPRPSLNRLMVNAGIGRGAWIAR